MRHLAIIADGNRRWAANNNLPVRSGYMQGLVVIERVCEWAINNSIKYLTVYCFSTENWRRSTGEVDMLFKLAHWYLDNQFDWYVSRGIKVQFIGRRDRFSKEFRDDMLKLETATIEGESLSLNVCVDYGGRDEIVRAIQAGASTEEELSEWLSHGSPDPDLILRTGGDQRLSNFMLWQSAYSELMFIDTYFPDLDTGEFDYILESYYSRKRNYGK